LIRAFTAALCLCLASPVFAADLDIGYLSYDQDPRYDQDMAYARVALRPQGESLTAAKMAISDLAIVTDARGMKVTMHSRLSAPDDLISDAEEILASGARYLVVDLAASDVDRLAQAIAGRGITIINATAPEDWLRRRCYPHLLQTSASDRMISDALVQHMVRQKWKSVLILQGKTVRDQVRAASFAEAAARFRIKIVESREFDLSTNPALREQNNIALLTATRSNYDAIFIADEQGEFSRYVPYQSAIPRPVIGSTGLVALEWHWALERYGAPQVNSRFEIATPNARRMGWQDWSVWVAVRAILTAHAKSRDPSPEGISAYLRSGKLKLDGSKGAAMSFRPWDGQLRMPILLATHNAIIDIAPLNGFLHQTDALDSLGQDEAEFSCE
jgi:ABC transporter substrate binding protein (PQQ-dependent alcohol dehydrogenase system)